MSTVRIRTFFYMSIVLISIALSVIPAGTISIMASALSNSNNSYNTTVYNDIATLNDLSEGAAGKALDGFKKIEAHVWDDKWLAEVKENMSVFQQFYKHTYGVTGDNQLAFFITAREGADVSEAIANAGGKIVKVYEGPNIYVAMFKISDPTALRLALLELARNPHVVRIEPDGFARLLGWDNAAQLHFMNLWYNMDLRGDGVKIFFIDTGVDPANPAIPDPAYWIDYVNGSLVPVDDLGHGTSVAGVAIGRGFKVFPDSDDGMWHPLIIGDGWLGVDKAVLSYVINVSGLDGDTLTLEFRHVYTLWAQVGDYIYTANATIQVRFDSGPASTVATFEGNLTTPTVEAINITVPSGAEIMNITFIYDYVPGHWEDGHYYLSYKVINGWFIDYIKIYRMSDPSDVLLYDPVNLSDIGPGRGIYWVRTPVEYMGVAPNATYGMARVCSSSFCVLSAVLDAMMWALDNGADILSLSLALGFEYNTFAVATDYLTKHGVLVVAAAGNFAGSIGYGGISSPGLAYSALTVGASDKLYRLAGFSSIGPASEYALVKPDILAPGYGVSAPSAMSVAFWPDFPFAATAGTSISAPIAAGLAALIMEAHPDWTPQLVKSSIISTGDWPYPDADSCLTYPYNVYKVGGGIIDPTSAVNLTVIPKEANLPIGLIASNSSTIEYPVTLINTGDSAVNVRVDMVKLFLIDVSDSCTDHISDYGSHVLAPNVGDMITILPGHNATINLTIDTSTLPEGVYGGVILFDNMYSIFHVIFGFTITSHYYVVNGTVNNTVGAPLEGVHVVLETQSPYDFLLHQETYTDSSGYYEFRIPYSPFTYSTGFIVNLTYSLDGYYPRRIVGEMIFNNKTINVTLVPVLSSPDNTVVLVVYGIQPPDGTTYSAIDNITMAADMLGLDVLVWYEKLYGPPSPVINESPRGVVYIPSQVYEVNDFTNEELDLLINLSSQPGHLIAVSDPRLVSYMPIYELPLGESFIEEVLHVNTSDWAHIIMPDTGNLNVTIMNVRPFSTVLGSEAYSSSTPGGVLGNITIDSLLYDYLTFIPTNGGRITFKLENTYNVAVVSTGDGSRATTFYTSLPLQAFNGEYVYQFTYRLLLSTFDTTPPSVNNKIYKLAYDNISGLRAYYQEAFTDDYGIDAIVYRLYELNYHTLIEAGVAPTWGVLGLGFPPLVEGYRYKLQIEAVDEVGNNASFEIIFTHHGNRSYAAFYASASGHTSTELGSEYYKIKLVMPSGAEAWFQVYEPPSFSFPPDLPPGYEIVLAFGYELHDWEGAPPTMIQLYREIYPTLTDPVIAYTAKQGSLLWVPADLDIETMPYLIYITINESTIPSTDEPYHGIIVLAAPGTSAPSVIPGVSGDHTPSDNGIGGRTSAVLALLSATFIAMKVIVPRAFLN